MIAKVLRENGFQPDKGMGTDLQGRLNPIELPKADHTFGIGFTPTRRDRQKAIEDHRRKSLDEYSNQSGSIPLSKVYEVIKPIPPMMSLNPPTSKGAIHKDLREVFYYDDLPPEIMPWFFEQQEELSATVTRKFDIPDESTIRLAARGEKLNNWFMIPVPTRKTSKSGTFVY